MSTNIELSDLLASYPPQNNPQIQSIITAKKEFSILSARAKEVVPKIRGQYLNHQLFVQRYLRAYDDLFLIHETGTGKTCAMVAFTEWLNAEKEKGKYIKLVYVLVKRKTQKNEFKNQLVCRCSVPGKYDTEKVKNARDEKTQASNVTREINKWYKIMTYESFSNYIEKTYPTEDDNDRLIDDLSDTVFLIDEAHNIHIDPLLPTKLRKKQIIYNQLWRVLHLIQRSKKIISTATPMINEVKEVGSLINLLLPRNQQIPHNFNYTNATLDDIEPYFRGKISFVRSLDTGAIPVDRGELIDDEYEYKGIRYDANLILWTSLMSDFQRDAYIRSTTYRGDVMRDLRSAERQAANFVFPDGNWGGGITEEEKKHLKEERKKKREREKRLRRGREPEKHRLQYDKSEKLTSPEYAVIHHRGSPPRTVQINPLPTVKSPSASFVPIPLPINPTTFPTHSEVPSPPFPTTSAQKSPPPRNEKLAFRRYINVDEDNFSATPEFISHIHGNTPMETLNKIHRYSCKYREIINLVENKLSKGNAFVYGHLVQGSGIIALALCFEAMGYRRFNENRSIFVGKMEKVRPYCSTGEDTSSNRVLRPEFQTSVKRYAILSGETNELKFRTMMEAMNSYENRHGDIIRVFISSPVGRDGININNATQIHLIGGDWTQSSIYQALSRGIRATSHIDLLREEEEEYKANGRDPNLARIAIDIYKHTAIAQTDDGQLSVDKDLYILAEGKDRQIRKFLRLLKQVAIDCHINRDRNIRLFDAQGQPFHQDGTAICDYTTCDYKCYQPKPDYVDYSTFDVLYVDDVIITMGEYIKQIFSRFVSIASFPEIVQILTPVLKEFDYRIKYIILALEKIINDKEILTDKFGYKQYLREDHGIFYLDQSYLTLPSYSMAYYSSNIISIQSQNIDQINEQYNVNEFTNLERILIAMNPQSPEFVELIDSKSISIRVSLLEDAIIRVLTNQKISYTDFIINKFANLTYQMHEPRKELNKALEQTHVDGGKRGRKPRLGGKKRIEKITPALANELSKNIDFDTDTPIVYLHSLYTLQSDNTEHATTAHVDKGEGILRILNPSEKLQWRNLTDLEYRVYNIFIQLENISRKQIYRNYGIYGFVQGNKFKIVDQERESAKAVYDSRSEKKGKVCNSWDKDELVNIMWRLNMTIPPLRYTFTKTREELRDDLVKRIKVRNDNPQNDPRQWDFERLQFYYIYMDRTYSKDKLCNMISEKMKELGRLRNID